jgi:CheY-like chemotaxis protein
VQRECRDGGEQRHGGCSRFLVVDDEPDMRGNVVRILRRGPYACTTAGDGQQALVS